MVDTIMNVQPVKLFENGRDVVSFLTFCDSSSCCILRCLWTIELRTNARFTSEHRESCILAFTET